MTNLHEAAVAVIEERPDAALLLSRVAAHLRAKGALSDVVD